MAGFEAIQREIANISRKLDSINGSMSQMLILLRVVKNIERILSDIARVQRANKRP